MNTYSVLAKKPQTTERARKSPCNWVREKKKEKKKVRKESGRVLHPLEGGCERGKIPVPWEASSQAERLAGTELELQSLRGECSSWWAAVREGGEL